MHIERIENKLDKLELTIKRLVLLQVLQNEKKLNKDSKVYLERLDSIANDLLNQRAHHIAHEIKKQENEKIQMKETREWERTLRFVCPSKFLNDKGDFGCNLTHKDCMFSICPKRKEFETLSNYEV